MRPMKSDKRLIPLTMIPLSGAHCIFKVGDCNRCTPHEEGGGGVCVKEP